MSTFENWSDGKQLRPRVLGSPFTGESSVAVAEDSFAAVHWRPACVVWNRLVTGTTTATCQNIRDSWIRICPSSAASIGMRADGMSTRDRLNHRSGSQLRTHVPARRAYSANVGSTRIHLFEPPHPRCDKAAELEPGSSASVTRRLSGGDTLVILAPAHRRLQASDPCLVTAWHAGRGVGVRFAEVGVHDYEWRRARAMTLGATR